MQVARAAQTAIKNNVFIFCKCAHIYAHKSHTHTYTDTYTHIQISYIIKQFLQIQL